MKELLIKKCNKCGALVSVLKDCTCENCGIKCCGQEMISLKENSTEASIEKHKPVLEVIDNKIKITVNHVMEKEHYIEWVKIIINNEENTYYFEPEDKIDIEVEYNKDIKVYSYCNIHGLWSSELK